VSEAVNPSNSLVSLVQAGRLDDLEKRWQSELPGAGTARPDMLAALEALIQVGQAQVAELLAGSWLEHRSGKVTGDDDPAGLRGALQIARELLLRVDSADFRKTADSLYRRVHRAVPHIDGALKASGLVAASAEARKVHPKKAVRLLDTVLGLAPGQYVVRRGEDRAAEVVSIDPATAEVTVKSARGSETVNPGDIADSWEAVGGEDFRVLEQLRPARLAELAKADPGAVALSLLRARGGKTDSNHVRKVMSPKHVSAADYDGWWTRARNVLKRDPNVRMEGRSPVSMVYDPSGRNPTQDVQAAFAAAAVPRAKWDVAARFARDAAARKQPAEMESARSMQGTVADQLAARLARSPNDLDSALLMDEVQAALGGASPGCAVKMLKSASDPAALITALESDSSWLPAVAALEAALPEKREENLLRLLPAAPPAVADAIAE
jgi:hypothetical protein